MFTVYENDIEILRTSSTTEVENLIFNDVDVDDMILFNETLDAFGKASIKNYTCVIENN